MHPDNSDNKDSDQDAADDDDDDGTTPLFPPQLLQDGVDQKALIPIMLNACACSPAFDVDSAEHGLNNKALKGLYENLCSAAGFNSTERHIDIIRQCVLHLISHPDVRDTWIGFRATMQIQMPRTHLVQPRDGTHARRGAIVLYPPFNSCPLGDCESHLVAKHHKDTLKCHTLDGLMKVCSVIYTCNSCKVDFHYDHYRVNGMRRYYDGSVQGEQRSRAFSQVLGKHVWLPDYVRVGHRFYSWEFMQALTVQTIVGRSSYGKSAALFGQYLNQRNLMRSTMAERLKTDMPRLLDAHCWWRLMMVCIYRYNESSMTRNSHFVRRTSPIVDCLTAIAFPDRVRTAPPTIGGCGPGL